MQDVLWHPKCTRFGWYIPYTPADNEYGAWKRHYIACIKTLDMDMKSRNEVGALHVKYLTVFVQYISSRTH